MSPRKRLLKAEVVLIFQYMIISLRTLST